MVSIALLRRRLSDASLRLSSPPMRMRSAGTHRTALLLGGTPTSALKTFS